MPDDPHAPNGTASPKGNQEEVPKAQGPQENEGLKDYWDDILGPRPETIERRLVREFGATHPGVLTIGTSEGRAIVSIDPNGKVTYGEGYTPDAAAEEFWTNMALKRVGMEERLRHFALMEAQLVRLGQATLTYQRLLTASEAPGASDHDRQLADRARMSLASRVDQLVDYAAGLARRPPNPTPAPAPPPRPPRNSHGGLLGDPDCQRCRGEGTILGDCSDSPNVWYDPCPTCRPNPNCPACHGVGMIENGGFRESLDYWRARCETCRPILPVDLPPAPP